MTSKLVEINGTYYKECKSTFHKGERLTELTALGRCSRYKDGYRNKCKECITKEQRISNAEGQRKRYKRERRRKEGMAKTLWRGSKDNAKVRGIEFNLCPEDVIIPDCCPVFGIPLINDVDFLYINGLKNPMGVLNYPSIDRLDPTKGYIKSNINIISWKANNLKSNSTLEDLELLLKWVRSEYEKQHLER